MKGIGQLHAMAAFLLGTEPPAPHCKGGWLGPRASLGDLEGRKIYFPCRKSKHDVLDFQPVA